MHEIHLIRPAVGSEKYLHVSAEKQLNIWGGVISTDRFDREIRLTVVLFYIRFYDIDKGIVYGYFSGGECFIRIILTNAHARRAPSTMVTVNRNVETASKATITSYASPASSS